MQALYLGTKGALRQRDEKGDGRTALQNSRTDSNGLVDALQRTELLPHPQGRTPAFTRRTEGCTPDNRPTRFH